MSRELIVAHVPGMKTYTPVTGPYTWHALPSSEIATRVISRIQSLELMKLQSVLELMEAKAVLSVPIPLLKDELAGEQGVDLVAHSAMLERNITEYDHRIGVLLRVLDELEEAYERPTTSSKEVTPDAPGENLL